MTMRRAPDCAITGCSVASGGSHGDQRRCGAASHGSDASEGECRDPLEEATSLNGGLAPSFTLVAREDFSGSGAAMTPKTDTSRPTLKLVPPPSGPVEALASISQLARAYCGRAHGFSWMTIQDHPPERVMIATSASSAADNVSVYRLLRQPRSGRPAKDSQGSYLYLCVQDAAPMGPAGRGLSESLTSHCREIREVVDITTEPTQVAWSPAWR